MLDESAELGRMLDEVIPRPFISLCRDQLAAVESGRRSSCVIQLGTHPRSRVGAGTHRSPREAVRGNAAIHIAGILVLLR